MTYRLRPLAILLLSALAVGLSACSSSPNATDWFFGDALVVRVKEVRLTEEVSYSIDLDGDQVADKHYVIRPIGEGQVIAAARIEIRNRLASMVIMPINKDSARLRDSKFFDYRPIDPFRERQELDAGLADEDTLIPFIWADGSPEAPVVELPRNCGEAGAACELVGWMFFEVPRDIEFYQLVWEAADSIYLRF